MDNLYKNIIGTHVIGHKIRWDVLCIKTIPTYKNKGVTLLAYVESFLNQAPEDLGFERFVDVSVELNTRPTLLYDGINV